jgi:hypothetical protein
LQDWTEHVAHHHHDPIGALTVNAVTRLLGKALSRFAFATACLAVRTPGVLGSDFNALGRAWRGKHGGKFDSTISLGSGPTPDWGRDDAYCTA